MICRSLFLASLCVGLASTGLAAGQPGPAGTPPAQPGSGGITPTPPGSGGTAPDPAAAAPSPAPAAPTGAAAAEANGWEDAAPAAVEPAPASAPTPAVVVTEAAPVAAAPARPPEKPEDRGVPPSLDALGSYQSHTWIGLGVRTSYINDVGFDPFATDDALIAFDLALGRTLFAAGQLSVAAAFDYAAGGREATARDEPTRLVAQRLTLAPELRYHVLPRLFAFARPALGAERLKATIDESSTGVKLERGAWAPAFDLTAGAAVELYGKVSAEGPTPRLWLTLEGGYGWTGSVDLVMEPPDDANPPARLAPLDLGELTLRGPGFSIGARLSF